MSSIQPKQCGHCDALVPADKYHAHVNLHAQPHELVPKTRPNTLKKIGLSKVLHLDESTDESDIAVRSILPDEVPQPEVGRRDVSLPEHQGQFSRKSKGEKVGKGIGNGSELGSNIGLKNGNKYPDNDQLDLRSNIIGVSVQEFQSQQLDIEKEVDLKPKKTLLTKKEIHKYQNTHNAARQTIDMGGCDRKVMDSPLAQSRNLMAALVEPIYEIKEVEKPFLPISDPKNKATVSFSRKTAPSNPYNAIQTKSITSPVTGRKIPSDESSEYSNRNRNRIKQKNKEYSEESESDDAPHKHLKDRDRDRRYPLHPHECPDCHGFYCSTCKSTIPPTFRPFWDQNQKPEIIQYYKSIQQQAEKNKRHKKECSHCNQNE